MNVFFINIFCFTFQSGITVLANMVSYLPNPFSCISVKFWPSWNMPTNRLRIKRIFSVWNHLCIIWRTLVLHIIHRYCNETVCVIWRASAFMTPSFRNMGPMVLYPQTISGTFDILHWNSFQSPKRNIYLEINCILQLMVSRDGTLS